MIECDLKYKVSALLILFVLTNPFQKINIFILFSVL